MVLCAGAAIAQAAPPAPDTPVLFDARQIFPRPLVHVEALGRTRTMILDTGSRRHVIGFKAAGMSPATALTEAFGTDYAGRPIAGVPAAAPARLAGWPPLDGLLISSWADPHLRGRFVGPGEPQADGVIAPIALAAPDRVVVIDFTTSTLTAGSWKDAEARLATADVALTPSPVAVGGDLMLVLPMVAGDRTLRMMLDTGASTSWLFVPRDRDLQGGLTRISERALQVRVGDLSTSLHVSMMERLDPITRLEDESPPAWNYEGLLGMDVLRSCILAFDRERFVVRCLSNGAAREPAATPRRDPPRATLSDLSALRASRRRHEEAVQLDSNELEMRPRADGGFEWTGQHVVARIRRSGGLSFSRVSPTCRLVPGQPNERAVFRTPNDDDDQMDCPLRHTEMDAEDETRWFEAQVGDLLVTMARAQERELILDALAVLPRHLSAILGQRQLPLAQRRRILFLLWDEMAEPDDAERGWAGARARLLIEAFIRERLPAGAPGAYSAAELTAFNRTRHGGVRFEPYAAPVRDTGADP